MTELITKMPLINLYVLQIKGMTLFLRSVSTRMLSDPWKEGSWYSSMSGTLHIFLMTQLKRRTLTPALCPSIFCEGQRHSLSMLPPVKSRGEKK